LTNYWIINKLTNGGYCLMADKLTN